jgi:hypothetical protein
VISRTETKYPDYHRVGEDGRLVIGSYFGEDKHDDPNDYGDTLKNLLLLWALHGPEEIQAEDPKEPALEAA